MQPEHLNDDRLGRVLDQLYLAGSTGSSSFWRQNPQCPPRLQLISRTRGVRQAAERFARQLKYHGLEDLQVIAQAHHPSSGRPSKDAKPSRMSYSVRATLVPNLIAIEGAIAKAGRFIRD